MLKLLHGIHSALLCMLAKRDVALADRADASGDPTRALLLLDRADARLKKACGCEWPSAIDENLMRLSAEVPGWVLMRREPRA